MTRPDPPYATWIRLARRAGRTAVGATATSQGLVAGDVELVALASDASAGTRGRIERLAARARVPVVVLDDRDTLGELLGRDVVSVVGLTDAHLARALRGSIDDPAEDATDPSASREEPDDGPRRS